MTFSSLNSPFCCRLYVVKNGVEEHVLEQPQTDVNSIMKWIIHQKRSIKVKRHNLDSTEAISVVNSKRSTTHGHLNALRDIKESSAIKIKNKIGEAYEKRHVSNDATLPTFCIFVSLFVCLLHQLGLLYTLLLVPT